MLWQPESEALCPDPTREENSVEGVIEMWFAGVHSGMFDFTLSPLKEMRVPTNFFHYAFNFRRWWRLSEG